ncbi:MAG: DUF190 domain-containing protein [Halothiobacillaceae bacterium]|nr:DUF190 domain-containing protein [Halothiobacillaceae bacterium]
MKDGYFLRFYLEPRQRLEGLPGEEWLLRLGRELGLGGASVFLASEGFGRDAVVHSERFFELGGDTPRVVEFVVEEGQDVQVLAKIRVSGLRAFAVRFPVCFESIGER